MTTRTIAGEVRCLNRSRSLDEMAQVGDGGRWSLVRPGVGGLLPQLAAGRLRCGRCGGRALIEWA
ncbi:MAG: hypothetical protein AB7R89_16795 [Dehalococcoidia bacterium]